MQTTRTERERRILKRKPDIGDKSARKTKTKIKWTLKLETFQFILLSEMIIKSKVPYNIVIESV